MHGAAEGFRGFDVDLVQNYANYYSKRDLLNVNSVKKVNETVSCRGAAPIFKFIPRQFHELSVNFKYDRRVEGKALRTFQAYLNVKGLEVISCT